MALLDEARARKHVPGPSCDIERVAMRHPMRDDILELLRDQSVSHATVLWAFNKHDIPIGRATIERHRHNQCGCCRRAGRVF